MALEDFKITSWDAPVVNMDDNPSAEGVTAAQLKAWFDSNSNQLKDAINGLIDALSENGGGELVKGSGFSYIRINSDGQMEVSTDGESYVSVASGGHVIMDTGGTVYTQRTRLMVAGDIEDTGDATYLHGIPGERGPAGPAGSAGQTGPQGPRGKVYFPSIDSDGIITWTLMDTEAIPAAANIRGPQGPAGPAGQGIQGQPGIAGPQGSTGPRGPSGPAGQDGQDGQDGRDGQDGQDGAPGPNLVSSETETEFTGILKGNGSTVTTATAGTDYQAPLTAGTDYQTPLVAGTDYQTPLTAGTDYQTPLVAGTDYQTPLVAGTDYQTPLVAGTDYQTPLTAGTDYQTPLPSQSGQSGKFLTTDGSALSWASAGGGSGLPSQTGNSGKFLTTDGTDASWAAVTASGVGALPISGGTLTGALVLAGAPTADLNPASKKYVDDICGDIETALTTINTALGGLI